jgi:hypothetical protein
MRYGNRHMIQYENLVYEDNKHDHEGSQESTTMITIRPCCHDTPGWTQTSAEAHEKNTTNTSTPHAHARPHIPTSDQLQHYIPRARLRPAQSFFHYSVFISLIIPSEESWKASREAGCPSAGFGPLISRFPLLCSYMY